MERLLIRSYADEAFCQRSARFKNNGQDNVQLVLYHKLSKVYKSKKVHPQILPSICKYSQVPLNTQKYHLVLTSTNRYEEHQRQCLNTGTGSPKVVQRPFLDTAGHISGCINNKAFLVSQKIPHESLEILTLARMHCFWPGILLSPAFIVILKPGVEELEKQENKEKIYNGMEISERNRLRQISLARGRDLSHPSQTFHKYWKFEF